jgi:electron transport complex protein RnfD
MAFNNYSSPHLDLQDSVPVMMRHVLLALIPGITCAAWVFGWGILVNCLIASVTAVTAEAGMLLLRRRPPGATLIDGSALVTGILLALALPPLAPWWIPVIGSAFAIVVAKQLYGGLGYNPFNPAMAGYVVLLISFPLELGRWTPPFEPMGLQDTLALIFTGTLPAGLTIDGLTQATPMDAVKTQLGLNVTISELSGHGLFGHLGARGWEWINLSYLLGGLWLLKSRVIQWQIPVGTLVGLFCMDLVFYMVNPDTFASPIFQLFSGAAMLGAFFIATDPVSASTTPRGRLIFGAGIGMLTFVIRTWGGYPDGMAFAVLLMNMAAPTIDHYTQPRVFGHRDG